MITPPTDAGMELLEQLGMTGDGTSPLGCMQCGMCAASCPLGEAMEFPPRNLILQCMSGNIDAVLTSPSLWMCIGCYTCSLRCPRDIELTDRLWPALRDQSLQAGHQPPAELQETFQNLFKYGNTLGKSPRQRLNWAADLDVPVLDLSKQPQPVEVLWLVGCYPSYYPRNQVVTRGWARLMTKLGVSWGVLGAKEKSVGECERLFGEEGLFETLVEQNRKLLEKQEFEKLLTLDPHAYRALQAYYPQFGGWYPVQHYTMFLAERMEQLKQMVVKPIEATVTYHDNCCVGRRCDCYEPPRELLQMIPGVKLVEMERHHETALCCGGGGGGMWLDGHIVANGGRRLSDDRVLQAAAAGADILAVSCPYELSRFEDAAKVAGLEDKLQVRDIIELLVESMGLAEGSDA